VNQNILESFNPKDYIKLKNYKDYLIVNECINILFSKKEEKYNFDIDTQLFIDPNIKENVKEYLNQQFTNEYQTQPLYLLELKNAFIHKRTTLTPRHLLLTAGNKYISSTLSSKSLNYYEENGLLSIIDNQRIKLNNEIETDLIIEKNCLFLYSFSNLYHVLMEVIPNLIFNQHIDFSDFVFLLYGDEKNMLEKILRMLGFKNKFIKLDNLNVKVKHLFFPSFQTFGHITEPREEILYFPKQLVNKFKKQNKAYEYIYISRNDASQRITINEKEVIKILEKFNFKIIKPGEFSIEEQISIFSNAKYIIAPHGMGITNILFCKAKFTLVEIFVDGWTRNCYYRMVQLLKGNYRGIIMPSANEKNDLIIDLKILENILREDFR